MSAKSKRKGKVGEREAAKRLEERFGTPVRRGVQYQGGPDSPDVVGLPGVHVEVKRTEKLRLWEAINQAVAESPSDSVPMVMHRPNGKPWVVIVLFDDLPRLAEKLYLILAENA